MKFSLSRFLPHLPGKALQGFCPSLIGRFLFLGEVKLLVHQRECSLNI